MVDYIKSLLIDKNGKIIPSRTTVSYLKKKNIYDYIINSYIDSDTIIEKLYRIFNNLKEKPKCKICGKELIFRYNKFKTFCSQACTNKDPDVLEKNRNGVSKSLKLLYEERGDEIKEKRSITLFNNYGIKTNTPFGIKEIQDKATDSIEHKYGVHNILMLDINRDKRKESTYKKSIEKYKSLGYDIEYLDKRIILVKNGCKKHGNFITDCITLNNRTNKGRTGIVCTKCNPVDSYSSLELIFEEFIQYFCVKYITNKRNIIPPQELDFYFPDNNIAVELNGIYWHSEKNKDKFYHINKTNKCKEKGIRLIHLWEDDIVNKPNIIRSMFSELFNKTENIIESNKCEIKKLDTKTYLDFLNINYIQGKKASSLKYGLFYNDELIFVIGFSKLKKSIDSIPRDGCYELCAFCAKLFTVVNGGVDMLLKYFENNIKYNMIVSYVKKR